MPFKEKIAWVALVGIVGAFAAYFGMIALEPHSNPRQFLGLFLMVVTAQTLITIAASVVVAVMSPADARAPADERDRQIARNAAGSAYYVLLVGVVLAAITIHLGFGVFWMMNSILAAIMIGEATKFTMQIKQYRH